MPPPPSLSTLIRNGVCDILDALDLGCPVVGGFLTGAPDAVVGVMTYPAGDSGEEQATGSTIVGVQVRIRGDADAGVDPVDDRREAIHDALTWREPREVGGQLIGLAWRETDSPITNDGQTRPEVFDSYYLRSDRLGLIT